MNIINQQLLPVNQMLTASDEKPSPQQAALFSQLLKGYSPSDAAGNLSPQDMLTRQINTVNLTVGVDLCAKLTGSVSQSINKLVNMT